MTNATNLLLGDQYTVSVLESVGKEIGEIALRALTSRGVGKITDPSVSQAIDHQPASVDAVG